MFKKAIIFLLFICHFSISFCQSKNYYRIHFSDKGFSPFSAEDNSKFLSKQAITRRVKQNIVTDYFDLPISPAYIDSLKKIPVEIISISKWLNTAIIATDDSLAIKTISDFSFVTKNEKLKRSTKRAISDDKLSFTESYSKEELYKYFSDKDYGYSYNQIKMLQGDYLHQIGYLGKDKTIAIIDAGFFKANTLAAFSTLFARKQILGTKNFVNNTDVYQNHYHGMNVLSVIGANLNGNLVGTAPEACFWLLQSEDADYEYIEEEDFWVAAAEFADSVGVDIIQSSLGYTIFDDSTQNHSYEELDGKTTIAARGANMAAKKGILVICSAGNSGELPWKYIGTPADADSAMAIGAVNSDSSYAGFSSIGLPNSFKVKPNTAAQGRAVIVASVQGGIQMASGTSFSAPIISGLAACLWQAFPEKTNMEIFKTIESSANQFDKPDSLLGYGLPNFYNAYRSLAQKKEAFADGVETVFPNPFCNEFRLFLHSSNEQEIELEVYDFLGRSYLKKRFFLLKNDSRIINIHELEHLNTGIYFLQIKFAEKSIIQKILKSCSY